MGLKISVNTDGMSDIQKALTLGCQKAEHIVAEQIKQDTEPFVPALTNSLTNRTRVVGNLVIYPGPYARFLYHGKVMVDPETGSPFARRGVKKVETDRDLAFNKTVHPQAQSHWFEVSKAQNKDKWLRVASEAVKKYGAG